jgi:hypothetical protein
VRVRDSRPFAAISPAKGLFSFAGGGREGEDHDEFDDARARGVSKMQGREDRDRGSRKFTDRSGRTDM